MICPHLSDSRCKLAEQLVRDVIAIDLPVVTTEKACNLCRERHSAPTIESPGTVVSSLASAQGRLHDDRITEKIQQHLKDERRPKPPPVHQIVLPYGPGHELEIIMAARGVPSCQQCYDLARQMDAWGVVVCRERRAQIVDEIMPRAKEWAAKEKPWVSKLLGITRLDAPLIRRELGKLVDAAIANAHARLNGDLSAHVHGDATYPAVTRRHLIYSVAPVAKSRTVWQANVRQILRRIDLFNGRKVIGIATTGDGLDMDPPEMVREAFAAVPGVEFIERPNSRTLREVATFLPMLEAAMQEQHPGDATFYAHTKGVISSGDATGVMYWRNGMYATLLDHWSVVGTALECTPVVGTHRIRYGLTMPDRQSECPWHFAGTYFWFRNAAAAARDWRGIQGGGYAAEAWPGTLFRLEESACLWMCDPTAAYDPATYTDLRLVDA